MKRFQSFYFYVLALSFFLLSSFTPLCLFVCLPASLSICLYLHSPICLPLSLVYVRMCLHLYTSISIYVYIRQCTHIYLKLYTLSTFTFLYSYLLIRLCIAYYFFTTIKRGRVKGRTCLPNASCHNKLAFLSS